MKRYSSIVAMIAAVFSISLAAQTKPLRVGMIPDAGATQASVMERPRSRPI